MADDENAAPNAKRQVTTTLETPALTRLDDACGRLDRDRAWVLRTALMDWLERQEAQRAAGAR